MEEKSLLQTIQYCIQERNSIEKALFIGFEEWAKEACLYALHKTLVKSSLAQVEMKQAQLDFFSTKEPIFHVLSLDSIGKKEKTVLDSSGEKLLVFAKTAKTTPESFVTFHFQKMKPWEVQTIARTVVRFLLDVKNEKAIACLAEILVQKPALFASEIEKYTLFAHENSPSPEGIEELFSLENSTSLWKLFDAFVMKEKKTFFQLLATLEDQKEAHPLQLLRFFRSQWEKLLLMSESGEIPAYTSQKQKVEMVRKKSTDEKRFVLEQFLLYDKAFRDGEFEENTSFVPFFLTLFKGHP